MDYIKLLNRFWKLHKEQGFTPPEMSLYFFLLSITNSLGWKNPFQQSNILLYPSLQMSEKTLIAARARLQTAGLLKFKPGHKRHPTTYQLAPHDELFLQENTLEITASNLLPIQELTEVVSLSQHPVRLEITTSSLNETVPEVKNQTVRTNERARIWSEKNSLIAAPPHLINSAIAVDEPGMDADQGPLGNNVRFEELARQVGYFQIAFETYRLQMLAKARNKSLCMSAQSWRNWVMEYLNRESIAGRLLQALGPNQHRPEQGIGNILAKATAQAPVL